MGAGFVNSGRFQVFGWFVVAGVCGINFYLVASQILDVSVSGLPDTWWMYLLLAAVIVAYVTLIGAIVKNDVLYAWALLRRRFFPDAMGGAGGGGGMSVRLQPGGEEAPLSLEAAYDQPEEGSPAWLAAERLAGRNLEQLPDPQPRYGAGAGAHRRDSAGALISSPRSSSSSNHSSRGSGAHTPTHSGAAMETSATSASANPHARGGSGSSDGHSIAASASPSASASAVLVDSEIDIAALNRGGVRVDSPSFEFDPDDDLSTSPYVKMKAGAKAKGKGRGRGGKGAGAAASSAAAADLDPSEVRWK